jgi:hypothetical protein
MKPNARVVALRLFFDMDGHLKYPLNIDEYTIAGLLPDQ